MKKTLIYFLLAGSLSSCSISKKISNKSLEKTKTDTVFLHKKSPEKTNFIDTIIGYSAYRRSKSLNEKATEQFYSGNEKSADSLYRLSLKLLAQSNLNAQDFNFLNLEDQFKRLEAYRELQEKEKNGVIITEKEINHVLKEEKLKIGKKFAEKVAYEKNR